MAILKRGIVLGTLAGAVLSITYTAAAIPLVGILLVATNIPGGKVFDALIGAGMFAMCAWPCAVPMGILPGMVVGAIGGFVIGLIVLPLKARATNVGTAIIGLMVAIGMVVSVNVWLYPGMIEETQPNGVFKYLPYLFWIALPSVLVLVGSTWVGWKILDANSGPEDGN